MDFAINDNELAALCGLPHIQQLVYLRGIRPYMDTQTMLVGVKRKISYQSIADELYVEAHQGIKSECFTRTQIRRALPGLVRVGLIEMQSQGLQLILKCNLAHQHFSVQNKVVTNSSQPRVIVDASKPLENTDLFDDQQQKVDIGEEVKGVTPLKDNNYLYLFSHFEAFWSAYPEKKSKQKAWDVFQRLNPDENLMRTILMAITTQREQVELMQLQGMWCPPWKYPANWLLQRCFEDEVNQDITQENYRAANRPATQSAKSKDLFWSEDDSTQSSPNNIIAFKRRAEGE